MISSWRVTRGVRTLVTRIAAAHGAGTDATVVHFVPQIETSDGPRGDASALEQHDADASERRMRSDVAQLCASSGGVHTHYRADGTRVLTVGTGEKLAESTPLALRSATAAAMTAARRLRAASVSIALPSTATAEDVAAVTAGAILAGQGFSRHTHTPGKEQSRVESFALETVDLVTVAEGASAAWARAAAFAEGTVYARDLVCRHGDELSPLRLEEEAVALAERTGLRATVLRESELEALGANMLLAVGQAATHKARLVALEYDSADGADETVAIVGKGVTFDTGGLNLKPTGSIEEMHMDMGGAGATLGAALAVATLAPPKTRCVFVVAIAENAVAAEALKPLAVLTSMKGSTVSVGNTDAEGRLCLADAITWVQAAHSPSVIVDAATLTGACVVALGEFAAGMFANDDALALRLRDAGAAVGERLHAMPIYPEHRAELTCDIADLSSTGKGRWGGACTAAAFLEHFVDDGVVWAHLDIAGPAMTGEARGSWPKGGTGFGAAALASFVVGAAAE